MSSSNLTRKERWTRRTEGGIRKGPSSSRLRLLTLPLEKPSKRSLPNRNHQTSPQWKKKKTKIDWRLHRLGMSRRVAIRLVKFWWKTMSKKFLLMTTLTQHFPTLMCSHLELTLCLVTRRSQWRKPLPVLRLSRSGPDKKRRHRSALKRRKENWEKPFLQCRTIRACKNRPVRQERRTVTSALT